MGLPSRVDQEWMRGGARARPCLLGVSTRCLEGVATAGSKVLRATPSLLGTMLCSYHQPEGGHLP